MSVYYIWSEINCHCPKGLPFIFDYWFMLQGQTVSSVLLHIPCFPETRRHLGLGQLWRCLWVFILTSVETGSLVVMLFPLGDLGDDLVVVAFSVSFHSHMFSISISSGVVYRSSDWCCLNGSLVFEPMAMDIGMDGLDIRCS